MRDICNFIVGTQSTAGIEYYNFVYERLLKNLRQPFTNLCYRVNLVIKGSGILKMNNLEYHLSAGTLFFAFPTLPYTITGDDVFTFAYISFGGKEATELLMQSKIEAKTAVYQNYKHLITPWMEAIRRFSPANAKTVTASVLMHTLSYIDNTGAVEKKGGTDKFSKVIEYIQKNYYNPNINVPFLANMFFYSDKYLSSLFPKKTGVKFTEYVNSVRVKNAIRLIKEGQRSVSEIAAKTGFSDQFYFSKVFKKLSGFSPTEYIKSNK